MTDRPYADRASTYAAHRWAYPPATIEFLLERTKIASENDVAEIASGTGAVAEQLVDRVRTSTPSNRTTRCKRTSTLASPATPSVGAVHRRPLRIGLRSRTVRSVHRFLSRRSF